MQICATLGSEEYAYPASQNWCHAATCPSMHLCFRVFQGLNTLGRAAAPSSAEQHECVVLCGIREAPAAAALTNPTLATASFPFQEHSQACWIYPASAASRYLQPPGLLEILHRETANGFGLPTSDKKRLTALLLELRYLLWDLISN